MLTKFGDHYLALSEIIAIVPIPGVGEWSDGFTICFKSGYQVNSYPNHIHSGYLRVSKDKLIEAINKTRDGKDEN